MKLKLLPDTHPILHTPTKRIKKLGKKSKAIGEALMEHLEGFNAVGLSANQVGIDLAITAIDVTSVLGDEGFKDILFNPEIIEFSQDKKVTNEGCLSLPGLELGILRSCSVIVRYKDINAKTQVYSLTGLNAVVVQHEIDHLNGLLMTDRAKQMAQSIDQYIKTGFEELKKRSLEKGKK